MTVLEYLEKQGYHFKVKGKEAILDLCPFCKHPHSKDRFLVNLETGAYICNRQDSCGAKGYFKVNSQSKGEEKRNELNSKNINSGIERMLKIRKYITAMDDNMKTYMNTRGISYETCFKACVGNRNGVFCFFYTDESGNAIGVKYRTIPKDGEKKKIWAETGSIMTLLNWDKVPKDSETLYITEGEIDMLSLLEIGIENVVSVPNGAGSHDWIELHYDWLKKFKEIILIMDNDKAGANALKAICDRLKEADNKIFKVDLMFYKDPNEILTDENGRKKLENILKNRTQEIEEDEIQDISEVDGDIKEEATSFGDRAFDKLTGGKRYGEVMVITGNPGSGKSTYLNNIMCNLLNFGVKIYTSQGEFSAKKFKQNIMKILSRPKQIETVNNPFKDKVYGIVTKEAEEKISKWLSGKLFIGKEQVPTKVQLLRNLEFAYKKYGIRDFFIDNLMTINLESNSSDKYDKQRELFIDLQEFAKKRNVFIAIVAHPRKNTIADLEDADMGVVSGASEIINLANSAFFFKRLSEKEADKLKEAGITASVGAKTLKDREFGDIGMKAYWNYEIKTGRFLDVKFPNNSMNKKYGWEDTEKIELTIENIGMPF